MAQCVVAALLRITPFILPNGALLFAMPVMRALLFALCSPARAHAALIVLYPKNLSMGPYINDVNHLGGRGDLPKGNVTP